MNKKLYIILTIIILIIITSLFIMNKNNKKIDNKNITQNIENNTWQLESKNETGVIFTNNEVKEIIEKEVELSETEKEKIDEYNFSQLELVKSNLSNFQKVDFTIRNYIDYNRKYEPDIKPIRKCLYVSTENWQEPFIFWFKLESEKYITEYGTWYYIYPKYEVPKDEICHWLWEWWIWCIDNNYWNFKHTISNKCRWVVSWYIYEDRNENWVKDEWEIWLEWIAKLTPKIISTDKDWYYSFDWLWKWEHEVKLFQSYTWSDYWSNKTIKLNLEEWEILENINYWVYKR